MNRRAAALLALLGAAVALPGQTLPWDVPHRGAIVFSRRTDSFDVLPPPSRLRSEVVVKDGSAGGHEWRYFAVPKDKVPEGFEQPGFADGDWALGRSGFSPEPIKRPNHHTEWRSAELCVRTHVDLGTKKPKAILLTIDHDDGVKVWLNGRQVVQNDGVGAGAQYVVLGEALDAWQRGDNVLAARCTNTGGWQHFDLQMAVFSSLPPGVKTAEDLQKGLREEREQADRVRRELFGGFRPAPLLLQGDLDPTGSVVRIPPGDLRDLGWWLATDLAIGVQGGSVQLDSSRMFRLGDLQLKGRAGPVDAAGWQTLDVTVKNSAEPAIQNDTKRFVDRFVRPQVLYGFDGKLLVKRRVEVRGDKARVAEFTTELQGRFLRGKDWKEHAASFAHREAWKFDAVRDNQDAEFRTMVRKSIEKGTARLRESLKNPDIPDLKGQPADGGDSYHSGRLAIGLLALVKGGLPKDDEVVQRCLDELRKRPLIDTYSLGNAIMALEAVYAPLRELDSLRDGTIDRPRRRQPTDADRALLQKWTDQLLANTDTRVDPAYLLRFNYTRGARFDHSVNQYGLLGLYSAHLCGIDVSPTVWEAAANHLLAAQSPGGGKVELELVDYRTHTRMLADPALKQTTAHSFNRAAGWSYEEPKSDGELAPVWGSMTCAGISGLSICQAAMLDYPQMKRVRLMADVAKARSDGFAWLAQNMTVRLHPGSIERQQHWIYYYLYGLERAALLSGVALIQDRDWYFEGAMELVLAQQDDGHWPPELLWDLGIERDAMAILFLKQSTLPVLTGQ